MPREARERIENLWDRATPVAPLLDAYRAEVLREAAAAVADGSRRKGLGWEGARDLLLQMANEAS